MYRLLTIEHTVKIPPTQFGNNIADAAFEILSEGFNGQIDESIGFIIVVTGIVEIGGGKILHGDACTYHPVKFTVLCYMPLMHEVVEGSIVELVEFGAFVRLGPSDGLIHVSQLIDDFVNFENMTQRFIGQESQKVLEVNDIVRARVIAVALGSGRSGKLGLTMRQPYLGKEEWIENQIQAEFGEVEEDELEV